MAERRKTKKNEGDESGTDGAEQKGGAEGKKKKGLTGALTRVRRRSNSKSRLLVLDPAPSPLEKTPPIIEPIDPVQPIASAAVVPSRAKSDDNDITVPSSVLEPVAPHQYDDVQSRDKEETKLLWEDVEKLRKALKEAYKKLEEREEEIEARVNKRVQEEVNKSLREAVKAQLSSEQIDEQRKVFADHLKEKEEKLKAQYEELLTSKDLYIKEQLEQKEKNEEKLMHTMKAADELETKLSIKVVEMNDMLTEKEEEITTMHLASEETVSQLKGQVDELVKKSNAQEEQIKELEEKMQSKEAENVSYKKDFESESNGRRKVLAEYKKLKTKSEQLRLEHQDAIAKLHDHEEEIQVLTAQVNAYSREVDKLIGLVTQNQEKHKTEVNELNEKLANELKSKQQMDNELARMKQQLDDVFRTNQQLDNELAIIRQQLDNVSADKENKVTSLEYKIENMKQANVVLKDKLLKSQSEVKSLEEEVASLQQMLSGFRNSWKLSPKEVSLSKELGRGGYGVVWVGQLRVAVKQLHKWIASQHNMEKFHHEISIMSQLRHPSLLQFIGAVLDDPSGCPMIVTEVMDTSLREAYERRELTPDSGCRPVILSIMNDAAEGLNYLHCLPDPIIHRDVSSANVLLQSIAGPNKWKGKISDFGSAKLAEKAITEGPGAFLYSAPEAFQNMANPDPTKKQTTKMDVFSYGILLCEVMTCRFPHRDFFQDMLHQVHSISNRPSGTRDTQGSLLHSLIVSCCHDDPYRRPTMKEIIEQLDIISK